LRVSAPAPVPVRRVKEEVVRGGGRGKCQEEGGGSLGSLTPMKEPVDVPGASRAAIAAASLPRLLERDWIEKPAEVPEV